MRKPKVPCGKNCEKRNAECRLSCEEWKAYEKESELYRELIKKNKAKEHVVSDYVYGLKKGSAERGRGSNL